MSSGRSLHVSSLLSSSRRRRQRGISVKTRRPAIEELEIRQLLTLQAVSLANPALYGASANGPSLAPSISSDGQLVAYQSDAQNIVGGVTSSTVDSEGLTDAETHLYIGNLTTGASTLANAASTIRVGSYSNSTAPILSADGRFALFYSGDQAISPNAVSLFEDNLQTGVSTLVASLNVSGSGAPQGSITQASVSADGRYVAFVTSSADVTASPTASNTSLTNIYVRDMVTGTTQLASVDLAGTDGGDGNSYDPSISADGSEVVFQSDSDNLVAHDTNAATDVFVRNLKTGVTSLVSANQSGTDSGDFASIDPVLSGDGNHVVFLSYADDLQSIHKHNAFLDVYERDLTTGVTTLISVNAAGNDSILTNSSDVIVSANGRYVGFDNSDVGTFPNPTASQELYLRDTQTNTTSLVSIDAAGTGVADGSISAASITPDGTKIAFVSTADNLTMLPTGGHQNVFVRNLTTGVTTLVSVNAAGTAGGAGDSDTSYLVGSPVAMTPDGTHIAFVSSAPDLVAGDNNAQADVFVRDLTTGTTRLVSTRGASLPASYTSNGRTYLGSISGNGQYVSLNGGGNDVAGSDTSGTVIVRNIQTGAVTAPDPNGDTGIPPSGITGGASVLSANGSVLAFEDAGLQHGNTQTNVYTEAVPGGSPVLVSVNSAGTGPGNAASYGPVLSGDGGTVVFTSFATNLVPNFVRDPNDPGPDLYARNLATGVTTLISVNAAGTATGDGFTGPGRPSDDFPTYSYSISADGRYVTFASSADNLTSIKTNSNNGGIYVRDLLTGKTQLVDVAPDGVTPANGASSDPVISANGLYVIFSSVATNLVPGLKLYGNEEVYVRDLQTGTTRLASVNPSGNPLIATYSTYSISANGGVIAFAGDDNVVSEIYAFNTTTGTSQVVGLNNSGALPTYNQAEGEYGDTMTDPIVSADGNVVGFVTNADNFAPNTTGVAGQLYLRDLSAGTTTLISGNLAGTGGGATIVNNGFQGFQGVTTFALSNDASTVAFTSNQDNLVNNEYLISTNVFVYQKTSTTANTGSISGEVFDDLNGNGLPDAGEAGVSGVTVYLDAGNVGHYVSGDPTTTTNAGGDYTFLNLAAGTYSVGEIVPTGTRQTNPGSSGLGTVTVTAGQSSAGPNFGLQALPSHLIVNTIVIPTTGIPGETSGAISYQVTDQQAAASGSWQDAVYLSTSTTIDASATLIAVEPHTGGLAVGASYTVNLTGVVIPVLPAGNYHVLVQVDRRGQVPEPSSLKADEASASSGTIAVSIPSLTLGTPISNTFTQPGQDFYYQINVSAGQNLLLSLASLANSGTLSISERFSLPPVPGSTDETTAGIPGANQALAISPTQSGTYYIDVHAEAGAAASAGFTLTATAPSLGLLSASPTAVGNAGPATIQIDGLGFTQATRFNLIGPGGTIAATSSTLASGSEAFATFDLSGMKAGSYTLQAVATNGGLTNLANAVIVKAGSGAHLFTSVSGPQLVRLGRVYAFTITYGNTGDADAIAPLLQVTTTTDSPIGLSPDPSTLDNDTLQFVATSPDGPAGILRPGEQGTVTVYYQAGVNPDIVVSTTTAGDTSLMPYDLLAANLRPDGLTDTYWNAVYTEFQKEVGPTTGDYVAMLARNATLIPASPDGLRPYAIQLASQQLNVAAAAVTTSISGVVQSQDPTVKLGGLSVIATNATTGDLFAGVTLKDGSFAIPSVEPGTYSFVVNSVVITNAPAATVATNQAVTGVAISVNSGDMIAGRVTASSGGAAVAGASIEAVAADGTSYTTSSGADGLYRLTGLSAGTYTLVVQADGLAQSEVTGIVVSATPSTSNVSLTGQSVLTGSFTIESGGPTGGTPLIEATLVGSTDPNQTYFGTATGSTFSIPGLPAGSYTVSVSLDGYVSSTTASQVVIAGSTGNVGTLTLKRAASVSGTILTEGTTTPFAYAQVFAVQNGTIVASTLADANGAYEIDGLLPGSYVIETDAALQTSPVTASHSPGAHANAQPAGGSNSTPIDLQPGQNDSGPLTDKEYDAALAALRAKFQGSISVIGNNLRVAAQYLARLQGMSAELPMQAPCERCQPALRLARASVNSALEWVDDLIDDGKDLRAKLQADLESAYTLASLQALVEPDARSVSSFSFFLGQAAARLLTATTDTTSYLLCNQNCDLPHYPVPPGDPEDYDPNGPAAVPYVPKNIAPHDPNEKTGPGVGAPGYVAGGALMPYSVSFENDPTKATAAAQEVIVTDQLSKDLDWTTFTLGDITFGSNVISLPAGLQTYTTTVDTTNTDGTALQVDVTAGIDLADGVVTWTFRSVDPTTGQLQNGVNDGFLPIDDSTGRGLGTVYYSVKPVTGLPTGTTISNTASIVFDTNAPLSTATVTSTIDAGAPTSTVVALPAISTPKFTLSWTGQGDAGGSGVASYNVYVSTDGGAFAPFLIDTTATSATFQGSAGHTYGFYSVATNQVGNVQPTPTSAQASTTVPLQASTTTTVTSSPGNPVYGQSITFTATVASSLGGGQPTGTIQFLVDGSRFGPAVSLMNGVATSLPIATLSAGSHSITAVYSGDIGDSASTSQVLTESIAKASLMVTVVDVIKAYGDAVPTLTVTYTGFVNGDGPSSLSTPVILSTSATAHSTTGVYAIIASGGSSLDYAITYVNGSITVPPATLTASPGLVAFVTTVYREVLGRTPESSGLDYWLERLIDGAKPTLVVDEFFSSLERRALQHKHKAPTLTPKQVLADALRAERLADVPLSVLSQPGPIALVTTLYKEILGRAPEAAGQQYWLEELAIGTTRSQVALDIYNSSEHRSLLKRGKAPRISEHNALADALKAEKKAFRISSALPIGPNRFV